MWSTVTVILYKGHGKWNGLGLRITILRLGNVLFDKCKQVFFNKQSLKKYTVCCMNLNVLSRLYNVKYRYRVYEDELRNLFSCKKLYYPYTESAEHIIISQSQDKLFI